MAVQKKQNKKQNYVCDSSMTLMRQSSVWQSASELGMTDRREKASIQLVTLPTCSFLSVYDTSAVKYGHERTLFWRQVCLLQDSLQHRIFPWATCFDDLLHMP